MEAPVESTGGPEYEPLPLLIPCILCNRKFLPESLVRHKKACEKVLMKKRKQFNSAKQRLTGELAECLPLPPAKFKRPSPARKSSRWKEKHLELLETLRAARVGLAKGSQAAPLLSKPADHEQCPHCGRSFGPKAFDRHEEYCREKYARLEHHRPSVSLQAKERLEARTKYRAPCVKSRRSITREKYLPSNKREPSPSSIGGTTNSSAPAPVVTRVESKPVLSKQNSLSNTKENDAKAASTTGSHFVRASRNSSSFRSSQRRPSQTKPNPQPLAPKPAVNNQRNTEPIIRQTLQALPTNMKIKKDISSRDDSSNVTVKEVGWDPFESYVDNSSHIASCMNNEIEEANAGAGPNHDNISDLIDFSTPRQELIDATCDVRDIGDTGNPNNKVRTSYDIFEGKVNSSTESYRKLTRGNAMQCLGSDASSSDSGFGSFDLASREPRNQCVDDLLDMRSDLYFAANESLKSSISLENKANAENMKPSIGKRAELSDSFDTICRVVPGQDMLHESELICKVIPRPDSLHESELICKEIPRRDSLHESELICRVVPGRDSLHESELENSRPQINSETIHMLKSIPREDSQGAPNGNLSKHLSQKSSKGRDMTCEERPLRDFDGLQRDHTDIMDISFDRLEICSVTSPSSRSDSRRSSDADSTVYRQSIARHNDEVNGFIENAFKTSSLTQVKTSKSTDGKGSQRIGSEESLIMKREHLIDDNSRGSSGDSEKRTSNRKQPAKDTAKAKRKTPKKKTSRAQCEENTKGKQKVVKGNVKIGKVVLVNSGDKSERIEMSRNVEATRALSDVNEDTSDQHSSTTLTPRDDPYDSLEEELSSRELKTPNLYDSLSNLNPMEHRTGSAGKPDLGDRNVEMYELFSNENYFHEDDSSSIADSELLAIADKMNRLSTNQDSTIKPSQHTAEESQSCFDSGKTTKSNSSRKNENLLPLRNAKKSYNILNATSKNEDGRTVVIESVLKIAAGRDPKPVPTLSGTDSNTSAKLAVSNELKIPSEACAESKDHSRLLPPLQQGKGSAAQAISGRSKPTTTARNVKLPPLKKEPLKHKAAESKRGSNSTCTTLPPLNSAKKRAVSRIPKLNVPPTTKPVRGELAKKLPPKLFPPIGLLGKTLGTTVQAKTPSGKCQSVENLPKSSKSFKKPEEKPFVNDEKLHQVSSESVKEMGTTLEEVEAMAVESEGCKEDTAVNRNRMKLCASEEKMSPVSPYANSTMHEEPHFGGKVHSGAGGGCKASGDSAYNSLNRKTDHTSSASSSGSESSIPKPSKFCHECGTQYPLLSAKFCCQCGVRRLCLV